MSSLTSRPWSTIAVTAAMLLTAVGLVGPAEAATARSVSLGVSPSVQNVGATVTFSGKVTKSPKGSTVKIQRKSGTSWVTVSSTKTTSSSGAFAARVTLPSTAAVYSYRAGAAKTKTLATAYSTSVTVTATRKVAISIGVSSASVAPGGSTDVSGNVSPYVAGSRVAVQRLDAGQWVTAGTTTISSTGAYTLTVKPTASTSYRAAVGRNGLNGTATSSPVPVTVSQDGNPSITTATLPDATRGAAYSTTLTKVGKAGTWSILNLPAGLTLDPATGVITGSTFVAPGLYGVYPTFTETSTGRAVQKALGLNVVGAPLAITTPAVLPDGHRLGAYSVTFTKTGAPGSWVATQVPEGFTLNAETGTLTGTPTVAGIYALYITFNETGGGTVTKIFSLTVLQPKITTTSVPDGTTGTPYSFQFTKTGLDGTWENNGFLPEGFTLSPSGLLTGTPTEAGDFFFQVVFTETSTGASSKNGFLLHVSDPGAPTITTTSLPAGTIGTAYSATLAATPAGGTWSITTGSLPVGLSLNPTTGAITGTPTVAENAQFVVTYTQGGKKNTKVLGIVVPAAS